MKALLLVCSLLVGHLLIGQQAVPMPINWDDLLKLSTSKIANPKPGDSEPSSSKCLDETDALNYNSIWHVLFRPQEAVLNQILEIQPKGLIVISLYDYNNIEISPSFQIVFDNADITPEGNLSLYFQVDFDDSPYDSPGLFMAKTEVYLGLPEDANFYEERYSAMWLETNFVQYLELRCCYNEVENFSFVERRCQDLDLSGYSYDFEMSSYAAPENYSFTSSLFSMNMDPILDESNSTFEFTSIANESDVISGAVFSSIMNYTELELLVITVDNQESCSYLDTVVYTCCKDIFDENLEDDNVWWLDEEIKNFDSAAFDSSQLGLYSSQSISWDEATTFVQGMQITIGIRSCEFDLEKRSVFSDLDFSATSIAVPNPTAEKIRIETDLIGELSIRILDFQGKLIMNETIFRKDQDIGVDLSMNGIPSGFYLISISNDSKSSVVKVVKIEP